MLINPDTPWPPPGHPHLRERWESWRAWWSGDPAALAAHAPKTAPGGYWSKRFRHPEDRAMHAGLAGDVARTSADLLAGDTPAIDWTADGDDGEKTGSEMQAAWDAYAQKVGLANTMLEGGETCSAMGGVFLRPQWLVDLAPHALPTVVPADEAFPEFLFGVLRSVTFVVRLHAPHAWVERERGEVWRWLEHHEPKQIRHELWLGNKDNIGSPRPLTEHPTTEALDTVFDTTSVRPKGILVEYWPNMLPNPVVPTVPIGRSDYQGCETHMDALDTAWASWLRDIDLGKARILVAQEMLESANPEVGVVRRMFGGRTPAKLFDEDAKVFVPVPGMPMDDQGKPTPITPVEFKIRFEEHRESVLALVEAIVSRAGYSPQTFGLHVEGQLSGTAMRRREHRSYRTRDRKRRYARAPWERFCETLALINHALFEGPKPLGPPTLVWKEGDQADPKEVAEIVELLRRAQAASDEVVVTMAHPEWDDDQIAEEVARLADARERSVAPVLTGFEPDPPQQDNPPTPGAE